MNRRELLGSGALVAATTMLPSFAAAAAAATTPPAPHGHGKATPLSDAAGVCITKGEACLQHCIGMFSMGDASMAGCARAVSDMLVAARAVFSMALAGSKHTKAAAQLAMAAAKDCEAECKKYTHAPCKECAECCAKLISEASKI